MNPNTCEICSKKIYKFYEINSFPINIYHEKKNITKIKSLNFFYVNFVIIFQFQK